MYDGNDSFENDIDSNFNEDSNGPEGISSKNSDGEDVVIACCAFCGYGTILMFGCLLITLSFVVAALVSTGVFVGIDYPFPLSLFVLLIFLIITGMAFSLSSYGTGYLNFYLLNIKTKPPPDPYWKDLIAKGVIINFTVLAHFLFFSILAEIFSPLEKALQILNFTSLALVTGIIGKYVSKRINIKEAEKDEIESTFWWHEIPDSDST